MKFSNEEVLTLLAGLCLLEGSPDKVVSTITQLMESKCPGVKVLRGKDLAAFRDRLLRPDDEGSNPQG